MPTVTDKLDLPRRLTHSELFVLGAAAGTVGSFAKSIAERKLGLTPPSAPYVPTLVKGALIGAVLTTLFKK